MDRQTLQLHEVALHLGQRLLVGPLSLRIGQGEVSTLMGESGTGKSSLLAFLCGTLPPAFHATGHVEVGGMDVTQLPPESRHLGILFQDDLLFPHLTVAENLAFTLPPHVRSRNERTERIGRALADAGLPGFGERDPATLSGGQRARVGVMRVLLSEPGAVLLDEPFSSLDAENRKRFREFIFVHLRRQGLPTLMVTHDPEDAAAAGGQVIRLSAADGSAL